MYLLGGKFIDCWSNGCWMKKNVTFYIVNGLLILELMTPKMGEKRKFF